MGGDPFGDCEGGGHRVRNFVSIDGTSLKLLVLKRPKEEYVTFVAVPSVTQRASPARKVFMLCARDCVH